MALSGALWLGAVTPLGGVLIIAGWAWLAWRVANSTHPALSFAARGAIDHGSSVQAGLAIAMLLAHRERPRPRRNPARRRRA